MMYYDYYSYSSPMGGMGTLLQLGGWSVVLQLVALAIYVFTALALYTMAQRRAIRKPWLAWIPVVSVWILGSLSDQYRYVVRGQVRSKRKVLLVLSVVRAVLTAALAIGAVAVVLANTASVYGGSRALYSGLLRVAVLLIPIVGAFIAETVLKFMALYDVYISCDPASGTAYLVISILFSFTKPIFLFLCRNKELGMPPRRDESGS